MDAPSRMAKTESGALDQSSCPLRGPAIPDLRALSSPLDDPLASKTSAGEYA